MLEEPRESYQPDPRAEQPPAGDGGTVDRFDAAAVPPREPGPTAQEPLPPAGAVPPPRTPVAASTATSSVDNDRIMAALAWFTMVILQLPLLSVIMLLADPNKNQSFQRYHAVTSIVFWAAAIIYEILAAILYTVAGIVTLGCGLVCLWPIFFVPHAIALYYTYEAYMGREPVIPVITDFVRQQGWA